MTESAEEIVALARSVRLKCVGDDRQVLNSASASRETSAFARAGIKQPEPAAPNRSAFARAQWAADATAAEKTPPVSLPSAQPQPKIAIDPLRGLSASLEKTAPTAAAAMSKQQFLRVEIAAGGQVDLTRLESRMGCPVAGSYRGQATWLQRANADGSEIRAIAGMPWDLARLRSGLAGSTQERVSFSIGSIELKAFSRQGAKAPSGLPPTMLASTCDALLRAMR